MRVLKNSLREAWKCQEFQREGEVRENDPQSYVWTTGLISELSMHGSALKQYTKTLITQLYCRIFENGKYV